MNIKIVKRTEEHNFPDVGEAMETYRDGRPIYYLRCPECNEIIALDTKFHTVCVKEGKITAHPSLVCPTEGCNWHVWLKKGVAE